MAEQSRERELARAAEELHGATTDLLKLREVLEQFPATMLEALSAGFSGASEVHFEEDSEEEVRKAEYRAGLREQPTPRLPLLPPGNDPTLARRFEDELHGSS